MLKSKMTRRRFLAATSTAVIAMPDVRGAHAAGRLSIGFWDHWVPGANKASQTLCEEWAAKEKVELSIEKVPGVASATTRHNSVTVTYDNHKVTPPKLQSAVKHVGKFKLMKSHQGAMRRPMKRQVATTEGKS